jgi:hypothetical protein
MSSISVHCTIVFLIPENMGLAVGIVPIRPDISIFDKVTSIFVCMVLQPLLGFSTDIDVSQYGCTIEFPSPENSGVAVGISSLSSILLGISKFFIFPP